jgi:hypothetical protein
MRSADSVRDFNGFLRTVCVEPVDSQNNWHRRQFLDTVARYQPYVKIDESNESWVEVCRGSSKVKSSMRRALGVCTLRNGSRPLGVLRILRRATLQKNSRKVYQIYG